MLQSAQVALMAVAACVFSLLSGLLVNSADAHGVVVFAWVEGDQVHVESKFSGGRKVNGGKVVVLDSQGTELLRGTTDAQGKYDFTVPAKTDLKILLQAGMGHQGEWTVSASEIEAPGEAGGGSQSTPGIKDPPDHPTTVIEPASQTTAAADDLAAIEAAVEKALDRKLKPVVQMLVETRQSGPTLQDILGGIGYILGLIGVGAYVHSRKKS